MSAGDDVPEPQRRSTDQVEVIDARLDGQAQLLAERIAAARDAAHDGLLSHATLDAQRWEAHDKADIAAMESHRALHSELAANLREYKVNSNEWRQTLNDIRNQTLTRAEFEAKHGALEAAILAATAALEAKIAAVNERLSEKIEPLKDARISGEVERRTTRTVFGDIRVTLLLGATIIGTFLAIATYIAVRP